MHVHSFAPIATREASVLILGTMPGKVSLREQQYYAHPQNAFWRIVAELYGLDATAPYRDRVASLEANGVALWDVLQSCARTSSLDSDIDASSIVPNDFSDFFAAHPRIEQVCFNGATAAALYERHVKPQLGISPAVEYLKLPSTSPANTSLTFPGKLRAWSTIKGDA